MKILGKVMDLYFKAVLYLIRTLFIVPLLLVLGVFERPVAGFAAVLVHALFLYPAFFSLSQELISKGTKASDFGFFIFGLPISLIIMPIAIWYFSFHKKITLEEFSWETQPFIGKALLFFVVLAGICLIIMDIFLLVYFILSLPSYLPALN